MGQDDKKDAYYVRLTGIVKAKILRFDEEHGTFTETDKEQECYLADIAGMRCRTAKTGSVFFIVDRECREGLDD